ncbi:MAG: hypothetical protein ACON4C_02800 [Henriciella sp.]|jgi:hypothetical protein
MTTEFLAWLFSLYMIVVGARIVAAPGGYMAIIDGLKENDGLSFLCGVFVYFFGGTLLALHHDMSTALAAVVTVFTALMALEGLTIMVAPKQVLSLPAGIGFQHHSRSWGLVSFLLGLGLGGWALLG